MWIAFNLEDHDVPSEEEAELIFISLAFVGVTRIAFVVKSDAHLFLAQQGCNLLNAKGIGCCVFLEIPHAQEYLEAEGAELMRFFPSARNVQEKNL
jgi:hypothetical protein